MNSEFDYEKPFEISQYLFNIKYIYVYILINTVSSLSISITRRFDLFGRKKATRSSSAVKAGPFFSLFPLHSIHCDRPKPRQTRKTFGVNNNYTSHIGK